MRWRISRTACAGGAGTSTSSSDLATASGWSPPSSVFGQAGWPFRLAQAGRALHLPESWRLRAGALLRGRARLEQMSAILHRAARGLEEHEYAAALVCLDASPVGLAALAVRSHPRAVLLSLSGLSVELRQARSLRSVRNMNRLTSGGRQHPDLYSAVRPSDVGLAVFGSRSWRDGAIDAGLPEARTRVIHFGVPVPETLTDDRPPHAPARLLWAGRLSPEKGLHLFLPAVALLRRDLPLRLTILAAPGPPPYRSRIERMIDRLGLADVVEHAPVAPRDALPELLAGHDALLFHSVFAEPVAQLMLLAFAHGLVVVGPSSRDAGSLLRDTETAFCFADHSAHSIAGAIGRSIRDVEIRQSVRRRAFARVTAEHNQRDTIAAYDALLIELAKAPRPGRSL